MHYKTQLKWATIISCFKIQPIHNIRLNIRLYLFIIYSTMDKLIDATAY